MKLGELLNLMPKQSGARTDLQPLRPATKRLDGDSEIEQPKPKLEVAKELGFSLLLQRRSELVFLPIWSFFLTISLKE